MTKHLQKKPRASRSRDLRARTLRAHRASVAPPAAPEPESAILSAPEEDEAPVSTAPSPSVEAAGLERELDEPSPASSPAELRERPSEHDDEAYPAVPARVPPSRKLLLGLVIAVGIAAGAVVGNVAVTRLRGAPRPRVAAPIARDPEPVRPAVALPPPPPATVPAATAELPAASAPSSEYDPGEAPVDEAKAKELRAQVLVLLDRRKNAEAIPLARAAIDADPFEALGYLYLGSAFQDSGKWKEAMAVYKECVHTAKKGIVDECRAMVGRRGAE